MEQFTGTRKCPNCGKWSDWNKNATDRCEHCNAVLDPGGLKAKHMKEAETEKQKKQINITLIEIYPEDSGFTRFWKRIVQGFQITLMAVISFIIWLIAMIAS